MLQEQWPDVIGILAICHRITGRMPREYSLAKLVQEIEQLWPPELLSGASDEATFFAAKGKVLDILNVLHGEKSREFRVVKLTSSPGTVVKVVNHIIRRSDMNSPSSKVVNL